MDMLPYRDTRLVAPARGFAHNGKIKIKNHFSLIDPAWNNEIGVHCTVIPINHEVRIQPVIQRPLTAAHRAGFRFGPSADNRARLQTKVRAVFNCVMAIIAHAVDPFVQMRNVVTTVQIVINENFPVAFEVVMTPLVPKEPIEIEWLELSNQIVTQKLFKSLGTLGDSYKNTLLPG